MIFRRYELRIITENGRKIRGPIFTVKDHSRFVELIRDYDDLTLLRLKLNGLRITVPKEVLQTGHVEIKPVSFLYALIRYWRSY